MVGPQQADLCSRLLLVPGGPSWGRAAVGPRGRGYYLRAVAGAGGSAERRERKRNGHIGTERKMGVKTRGCVSHWNLLVPCQQDSNKKIETNLLK